MDDEPDVGLVDSHAEGVGGGNDPELACVEFVLDLALFLWGEPSVVAFGRKALLF